jgi:hypothetical protein
VAHIFGQFLLASLPCEIFLTEIAAPIFADSLLLSDVISTLYLQWKYHWNIVCFCAVHLNTYPARIVVNTDEGFAMCLRNMTSIYKHMKGFEAKGFILHRKRTWEKTVLRKNK